MNYVITKGLDLKLSGGAPDSRLDFATPDTFFIRPSDFRWMTPKLLVQAGDRVRVGTPLFCDKKDGRVVIVSPVGGTVREIVRGRNALSKRWSLTRCRTQTRLRRWILLIPPKCRMCADCCCGTVCGHVCDNVPFR